jgi:hypothetical protein
MVYHMVDREDLLIVDHPPRLPDDERLVLEKMEEQRTSGGPLEFSRRAVQEITGLNERESSEALGALESRRLIFRRGDPGVFSLAWLRRVEPPAPSP